VSGTVEIKSFLDAIAHIDNMWSIAAFAIAAVLVVLRELLASPAAVRRRGKPAPAWFSGGFISPMVAVIVLLAAMPIVAHTYLESQRARQLSVYRVRVTVLDPQGHPTSGATLRTTASNETAVTEHGGAVVAIVAATVPADRRVTIYADADAAFLHGRGELQLGDDPNPSLTIALAASRDATVSGLVEDENGRAVEGAMVQVIGGESNTTSAAGGFTLRTNAAVGQTVRVHAEKAGYEAVDQDHPAGGEPVTIVMTRDPAHGR
jgi:hypothetical protein